MAKHNSRDEVWPTPRRWRQKTIETYTATPLTAIASINEVVGAGTSEAVCAQSNHQRRNAKEGIWSSWVWHRQVLRLSGSTFRLQTNFLTNKGFHGLKLYN